MPWQFDRSAGRYRDGGSGRFMAHERVRDLVRQGLGASKAASDELAGLVAGQRLTPGDWRALMREELKGEYIRQYLLGRGGLPQMRPSDWGRVGGMLAEQYEYLEGFAAQVGGLTEGQIKTRLARERSAMYFNSAREAFERAQAVAMKAAGHEEERWRRNPTAESCEDCTEYESQGWQPAGHFPFPGDGKTACLTGCQCHKEYRRRTDG